MQTCIRIKITGLSKSSESKTSPPRRLKLNVRMRWHDFIVHTANYSILFPTLQFSIKTPPTFIPNESSGGRLCFPVKSFINVATCSIFKQLLVLLTLILQPMLRRVVIRYIAMTSLQLFCHCLSASKLPPEFCSHYWVQ